jgi:hypothetical protein
MPETGVFAGVVALSEMAKGLQPERKISIERKANA